MSIENMEDQLSDVVLEDAAEVSAAAQKLADDATPPLLQVLRGNPQPEELAALVAVISAAAGNGGGGNGEPTGPLERWGDRSQALNGRGRFSFAPRAFVNGELGLF